MANTGRVEIEGCECLGRWRSGGAMSARYDVSGDGVLSEEEMSALFTSLGLAKD